ncbi:DNA polymerase I A, chloroplastic/mitochondrial-like [Apium graveolens]|uniref:DNA polymerase I A, chloroplastic/mitochondrial-like n=1 Tax=Apium graveolens TaxID=4045 RepID=UPI003D7997EF
MASMGISTHSAPFKPPFPPFIWLSSSRSFWRASPKMVLLRSQVCTIVSAKNRSPNVTATLGSINFNQSSSYTNLPIDSNSRFEDARKLSCASAQTLREMEHKPITSLATSGTPELTRPKSSRGWYELVQKMKLKKIESRKNNVTDGALLSMQNKDERIRNDKFHSYNLDNIAMRGALKQSVGQEQKNGVQFNLHASVAQQKVDSEKYEAKNKGERSYVNGLLGDASTQQCYTMPINDYSSQTLGNEENISVTCIVPEAQPNGLSVHYLKEKMEKSPVSDEKLANGGNKKNPDLSETYVVETSAKRTNVHLREKLNRIYDKVLVVDNIVVAKEIVEKLTNQYRHLVHACDTEVAGIDVKQETPVNHGEIICFSVYSGPQATFGNGKSCIWVDVLDGGGKDLLAIFAPFFEDPSIKKVWHNYSFDNHIVENYGIKLSGFHADTMHMARLWDSSRRIIGGYSLEVLTSDRNIMSDAGLCPSEGLIGKISMKTIFGRRKLKKDGSEGKVIIIPPVEELQRVERKPWVSYSALDSISTLQLYGSLKKKLSCKEWKVNGVKEGSMFTFYEKYWRPFGELLVNLETQGMLVDRAYLAEIEKVAIAEQQIAADRFRNWASKHCPDARYMNVGSDTQLRQLFFGGTANRKTGDILQEEKEFKVPNVDNIIEEGKKKATKFRKITLHKIGEEMQTEQYTASGWPSMSGVALKALSGKVSAEYEFADEALDFEPDESIEIPETEVNEGEVTDTSAYGTAYSAFGGGSKGMEACHAIASLCEVCSIDSLISNFILPLQGNHISGKNGRIHCSLNINTETGRLSARRPNLQNQPALEKDRYKIRQAFIAAPGNSLIVADYGQLELRILAHLANCKSMLDAFKSGGDFHSRTAMNMYSYIRDAVEHKDVLLEWYPQPGEDKPPAPLLKDAFASERRKAKMLNFSIAYGKTTVGLARDWKVSLKEAEETVKRWYSDRKEVLNWQELRKKEAREKGHVHTLLGRARKFPSASTYAQRGHIERAAINTPVQGSAADVAMCAMLEIVKNARLKELGWQLLLQVHDEVILEGPTESAEVAKDIVVDCMSKPFNGQNILKVGLSVDAKFAQNWYAAK